MPRDFISFRADLKEQLDEAMAVEAGFREELDEATKRREELERFLNYVDNHRGADVRRKNMARVYKAPGADSKAAEVERTVISILEKTGPKRSDQILIEMIEMDRGDLLSGEARSDKLARLSTYLSRMQRRVDAPLVYDKESRTFSLRAST